MEDSKAFNTNSKQKILTDKRDIKILPVRYAVTVFKNKSKGYA